MSPEEQAALQQPATRIPPFRTLVLANLKLRRGDYVLLRDKGIGQLFSFFKRAIPGSKLAALHVVLHKCEISVDGLFTRVLPTHNYISVELCDIMHPISCVDSTTKDVYLC